MPITLGEVVLEYKSLPLTLNEDGSATVVLRKGYMKGDEFIAIEIQTFHASKEEVSAILDVQGIHGLTRRTDLSLALYNFCISKGAEVGVVS